MMKEGGGIQSRNDYADTSPTQGLATSCLTTAQTHAREHSHQGAVPCLRLSPPLMALDDLRLENDPLRCSMLSS